MVQMNTFLPFSSFKKSAKCLDYRRLGKQRVECMQLLMALLTGEPKRIRNHPACKMWENHTYALYLYSMDVCNEWISRGYKDSVKQKIENIYERLIANQVFVFDIKNLSSEMPPWLGNRTFHSAYRSNLLRKDPK